MKFNFGHGITLFFIFFMSISLYQVYKSTQYDNTLIKEDYYVDDLTLENNLTKKRNAIALKGFSCIYNKETDSIYITIPNNGQVQGHIELVSPVNKKEDALIPLNLISTKAGISLKNYRKGKWNLILDWKDEKTSYLYDTSFIFS